MAVVGAMMGDPRLNGMDRFYMNNQAMMMRSSAGGQAAASQPQVAMESSSSRSNPRQAAEIPVDAPGALLPQTSRMPPSGFPVTPGQWRMMQAMHAAQDKRQLQQQEQPEQDVPQPQQGAYGRTQQDFGGKSQQQWTQQQQQQQQQQQSPPGPRRPTSANPAGRGVQMVAVDPKGQSYAGFDAANPPEAATSTRAPLTARPRPKSATGVRSQTVATPEPVGDELSRRPEPSMQERMAVGNMLQRQQQQWFQFQHMLWRQQQLQRQQQQRQQAGGTANVANVADRSTAASSRADSPTRTKGGPSSRAGAGPSNSVQQQAGQQRPQQRQQQVPQVQEDEEQHGYAPQMTRMQQLQLHQQQLQFQAMMQRQQLFMMQQQQRQQPEPETPPPAQEQGLAPRVPPRPASAGPRPSSAARVQQYRQQQFTARGGKVQATSPEAPSVQDPELQTATEDSSGEFSVTSPRLGAAAAERPLQDFTPSLRNAIAFLRRIPAIPSTPQTRRPLLPPQKGVPKPTLVLDLDETLVHCSRSDNKSAVDKQAGTFIVQFDDSHPPTFGAVAIRPHVNAFLKAVAKHWEIVIFTASQKSYANKVIDVLDPSGAFVSHRLYREHCTERGSAFFKELSLLGRQVSKCVLVDNSPISLACNGDQGILVRSWYGDRADQELRDLLNVLQDILHTSASDMGKYLARRYGLQEYFQALRSNGGMRGR